jgi:hypothetical protein
MSPRLPVATLEQEGSETALGGCCPKCHTRARVVDVDRHRGFRTWRRHECPRCGARFSTEERIVRDPRVGSEA